jgi:alkylated DNA nucleotide flippase Atl1
MKLPQRALQVWSILIAAAHNRQVLTYQILGDLVGMPPIALTQPLGLIMRYCEENDLPPLTVLVVSQDTGKPGEGLTTVRDMDKDREKVFNYNWYGRIPMEASSFELDP